MLKFLGIIIMLEPTQGITIILDNFYTSYNHTDFGKKNLRKIGKVVGNIGNILRNASKKSR